jgi:hypothetical protein
VSNRARLRTALERAGSVHLDASVVALHAVAHPRYVELTRSVFAGLRAGDFQGQTSALTLFQLLVEPYRQGNEQEAEQAEAYLSAIPGLRIVPVTAAVARQAAQVRAQLGGSLERAVQVATALDGNAEMLLTHRSGLRRIAGMGVDSLESYAAGG